MTQPSFNVNDINEILADLDNIPHKFARPIVDKMQAKWMQKIKEIQVNGASNPQVQDDINQAEANSDSMKNE